MTAMDDSVPVSLTVEEVRQLLAIAGRSPALDTPDRALLAALAARVDAAGPSLTEQLESAFGAALDELPVRERRRAVKVLGALADLLDPAEGLDTASSWAARRATASPPAPGAPRRAPRAPRAKKGA
jgi:hypothetical protein